MLTFATSSKTVYVFYLKWVHSPAEPAHSLQNQDIIWFLQYNVIHSPTSLSVIVQLYEYNFSSHLFFFLRMLLRFSVIWTNLMDLKQTANMGSVWPFLYGYFSLKMVLMFIHVVKCVNPAFFFFFCTVIKNK